MALLDDAKDKARDMMDGDNQQEDMTEESHREDAAMKDETSDAM